MKDKLPVILFIVFSIGWCIACGYSVVQGTHDQIRAEGKAAKENGHPINSNPHIYDYHRELWREGWRSGNVVNE